MSSDSPTSGTAAVDRPAGGTVRTYRVEVIRGPDAGASVVGHGERIVVGSHRSAELVLSDRTVSRFHCELALAGDTVSLRDLGSRNGTWVDNVMVEAVRLRGPTIVTVGTSELRVELMGDEVQLTLSSQERFGRLVGASVAMRRVFAMLEKAASSSSNVLLTGEIGTGKDAAAEAIHEHSSRRQGPLAIADCAAPAIELEARLFGKRDDSGLLERCAGGTLILDDLGALVSGSQRLLQRALERGRVQRGDQDVPLDVRIVGVSRRDLRADVNADRFRPDLFQQLAVLSIRIPPLRERPEDIPLLIADKLDRLGAGAHPVAAALLQGDSIARLREAPWAGNVRELHALVERAVTADELMLDEPGPEQVPLIDGSLPLRQARRRWVRYFERVYLADLLARTGGNVSAAAALAGVDRVHLHRLIARSGLRDDEE